MIIVWILVFLGCKFFVLLSFCFHCTCLILLLLNLSLHSSHTDWRDESSRASWVLQGKKIELKYIKAVKLTQRLAKKGTESSNSFSTNQYHIQFRSATSFWPVLRQGNVRHESLPDWTNRQLRTSRYLFFSVLTLRRILVLWFQVSNTLLTGFDQLS